MTNHVVNTVVAGMTPVSVCEPNQPNGGGVVVLQEAFGVNDHILDITCRFAEAGYLAVSPHLFHRAGDPVIAYDMLPDAYEQLGRLDENGLLDDVDAALTVIGARGISARRTALVGFCAGGTVAFFAATKRDVGAAVTFYGGGLLDGRFGMPALADVAVDMTVPWLGLYGDADQSIPVSEVEHFRTALSRSAARTQIQVYEGVGHGFHCDARPAAFDVTAASDAWAKTLKWISTFTRLPTRPKKTF